MEELTMEQVCERLFALKAQKKSIEDGIAFLERRIKDEMHKINKVDESYGNYLVHLKVTPPTRCVDTTRLKADGLYEKYSKERAGSESVIVSENAMAKATDAFNKVFG